MPRLARRAPLGRIRIRRLLRLQRNLQHLHLPVQPQPLRPLRAPRGAHPQSCSVTPAFSYRLAPACRAA
ncbi:MAG: hypothetical protein EXR49_03255 [Dehalococcoidia bacterium]|nr:hypothetical protein [Dehalococcoidia bacterium]